MKHYANVLELYNVNMKDKIINLIQNSKENDTYVLKITDELNEIEFENVNEFKKDSKLKVFIGTKCYVC